MREALKRLLSPEYLVVNNSGPLGSLGILYLVLGLLFGTGLGLAAWHLYGPRRQTASAAGRAWAWFELWVCLAGLGTIAGRLFGWPGWSARIWPYTLSLLAFLGALAHHFRRVRLRPWMAEQLRILSFAPVPGGTARPGLVSAQPAEGRRRLGFLLGALIHLAGVSLIVAGRFHWTLLTAPLVLAAIMLPQAQLLFHRRPPRWMPLAPMLGSYAVVLLWLLYDRLGLTIIGWQGLVFPNPMTSLFYIDGILLAAAAWAHLCQLSWVRNELHRPALLWQSAVAILLVATLVWAGTVYLTKRTHGATASDPYAYAQMGVDLAERGTFLHRFSLFEEVMPLHIAWAPLQPVGYHIPRNELGDCPSVWATGASLFLATGYLLAGESGLYLTTPVLALLALVATWALVQVVLAGRPRMVRYLTGVLTVALLATSPEHLDRLLVPMADAPAQLFTVLTLTFALLGMHGMDDGRASRGWWLLAGISFGLAYWVRHTQLVLALPVLLAICLGGSRQLTAGIGTQGESPPQRAGHGNRVPGWGPAFRPWSAAIGALLAFGASALVAALPDIVYRWQVFGSVLATETTELPLMGVEHIAPVAWQMLREALAAGEWGYLFPLAVYGGIRLARDRRRETAVLGSTFAIVLLVHLTYRSLRLRDLISLFPLVDLAVAYGAVCLVRTGRAWAVRRGACARLGSAVLPVALVAWVILSLALARWAMIDRLWKPGWASFGYMTVEQRAAFDRLAQLTPPQAVVGASLNAGAVMLYAGRDAIRPYDSWTGDEMQSFLAAMKDRGRPVYLLDDGGLMADLIAGLPPRYQLTPVAELAVPIFYAQGRQTGWLYRLEWEQ